MILGAHLLPRQSHGKSRSGRKSSGRQRSIKRQGRVGSKDRLLMQIGTKVAKRVRRFSKHRGGRPKQLQCRRREPRRTAKYQKLAAGLLVWLNLRRLEVAGALVITTQILGTKLRSQGRAEGGRVKHQQPSLNQAPGVSQQNQGTGGQVQ